MTNVKRLNKVRFELPVKLLTGLFLLLYIYKIYRLFFIRSKLNDYLLSENLLHYEGGYIRRSLLGNLFIAVPESYWKIAVVTFYAVMIIALLFYMYRKCKDHYALLFFLCAPFGIRMVMFDFGSMYRKEFIFFIVIIMIIYLYQRYKDHTANLIISILLSIIMLMVHESFMFLAMPVIAWILYINKAGRRNVMIYVAACGVAFLLLSQTPSASQISSLDQFFAAHHIDWAKTRLFMTYSKADTINMATSHFMEGSMIFYLIFFVPIILYMFYTRMIDRSLLVLLTVQLAFCLALSIIAIDYGRWLSFVLVGFSICLFNYGDFRELSNSIRNSARQKLAYVLMLLFMLSVYLPHYIEDYSFTKSVAEYSFIEKISYSISEFRKENQ